MKVDLSGKVALVTGAARNIGRAIADVFAENGAAVIYTDVNAKLAGEAADRHPGCRALEMDVTDVEQVQSVVEQVAGEFGRLDIVVNNAGVNTFRHRVTIEEFPPEEWDRLIQVNLKGVYTVSRAAARIMLEQGEGRIINIASVAALVPLRLQSAFCASKAGVANLIKTMAIELGSRGVLVNSVVPGSIMTEGTERLFYGKNTKFRENVEQLMRSIPLGHPGEVRDVAYAALYLAAPESRYVNGHLLVVDGGWTAGYIRDF